MQNFKAYHHSEEQSDEESLFLLKIYPLGQKRDTSLSFRVIWPLIFIHT